MKAPAAPPKPPLAPPTADGVRFFENDDVASLLNIAPQTMRIKRMTDGGPPFTRLGGPSSRALYLESSLFLWLTTRPQYTSTAAEKAALHAAAKAAAPPKTRKRLANRRVDFVSPPVGSKPTPTRLRRSGAKSPRKPR